MINRVDLIASAQAAPSRPADLSAAAMARALASEVGGANPIGTPLRASALSAATGLASALGGGSPTTTAVLERATLAFGREAKALAIGRPDLTPTERADQIERALADGIDAANALPGNHNQLERAAFMLDRAAATLTGGGD